MRTQLPDLSARGLTFAYQVVGEDDTRLADGATRHVFADSEGRLRRAPADVLDALERFRA